MKNEFSKSTFFLAASAILILAAACGAVRYIAIKKEMTSKGGVGASGSGTSVTTAGGDRFVANKTEGYSFQVPVSWYVEQNGENAIVYPDYAPFGTSTPPCKIELSVFDNAANVPLDDWMADHLSEDPTVVSHELSSERSAAGSAQAVRWTGIIDGIGTVLVYAAADSKIYEIAPSSLDENATSDLSCVIYLDSLMSSLHLGT
jgi:hypothetical protein